MHYHAKQLEYCLRTRMQMGCGILYLNLAIYCLYMTLGKSFILYVHKFSHLCNEDIESHGSLGFSKERLDHMSKC